MLFLDLEVLLSAWSDVFRHGLILLCPLISHYVSVTALASADASDLQKGSDGIDHTVRIHEVIRDTS